MRSQAAREKEDERRYWAYAIEVITLLTTTHGFTHARILQTERDEKRLAQLLRLGLTFCRPPDEQARFIAAVMLREDAIQTQKGE